MGIVQRNSVKQDNLFRARQRLSLYDGGIGLCMRIIMMKRKIQNKKRMGSQK